MYDPDAAGVDSAVFLLQESVQYVFSGALRVAAQLSIADHLVGGSLSLDELSEATAADAGALFRIMRVLLTRGVFGEDDKGRYHLTPQAEALRTDVPHSVRDGVIFSTNPTFWQPVGGLLAAARTGRPCIEQFFHMPIFDYLKTDSKISDEFHAGMGQASQVDSKGFSEAYEFADSGVLVDVGGGRGRLLIEVLRRHSGWRGVLFDQHDVVADNELATLKENGRWKIVSGDFFESVPAGGDIYTLQCITHDWDDEHCVKVLRNCRAAMSPSSRLVVLDMLIPGGNDPHPGKILDLIILASFTGRERTRAEFAALFEAANLRLTSVTAMAKPGALSIIEAEPC